MGGLGVYGVFGPEICRYQYGEVGWRAVIRRGPFGGLSGGGVLAATTLQSYYSTA